MIRLLWSIIFIHIFYLNTFSQDNKLVDSLKIRLKDDISVDKKIAIYNELSWQFSPIDFNQAAKNAKKAIQLSLKTNDKTNLATSYNRLALAYDYAGNLDSALSYYNISYSLRIEGGDVKGAANILNNIGACYHYQSVFDSSLTYYLKALKIREKIQDKKGLSESYNNVGIILRTQKEYKKAKEYYLKSLAIKKSLNNKKGMMYTYSNLAVISRYTGKNEEALIYSKNALELSYELQDSYGIGGELTNIGVTYRKLGQFEKAIENLLEGNKIFRDIGDAQTLAQNLNSLGDAYYSMRLYNKAISSYTESLSLANELNRQELRLVNVHSLSEVYASLNQHQKAWEYLSQYTELNKDVFNQDKSILIADLETKYQSEKKQKEIIELSAKNKLHELQIENDLYRNKIFIAIIVISLLIMVLFLFLYRSKRNLSNTLEEKNRVIEKSLFEKETLLKEIHHRVKNNLQVISSLLSLQSRYIDDKNASKAIEDSKNRVKSMALIHQKLYQEDNLKGVNMNNYIHELTDSLVAAYKNADLTLIIESEDMELDVDTVIPIGLIMNELITNSLKYGVKGSNPELKISFAKKEDQLELIVKDNGDGLQEEIDFSKWKSYGMKLVHSLSRKLKAEVSFTNDNGLEVKVLINKFKLAT